MNQRNRNFVFTWNNWDPAGRDWLLAFPGFKYIMFAAEVAPDTLTPHLQGYFTFPCARTISAAQALIQRNGGPSMHLEVAKGSYKDNREYIQGPYDKHDKIKPLNPTFIEQGTPPAQGNRTDIHEVTDQLRAGVTLAQLIRDDFCVDQVVKYHRGLQLVEAACQEPRRFKTEVWWLFGPTGSGKSRWAWDQAPEAYSKPGGSKWWCGYHGQEDVIFDDFRPSKEMPFEYLLNLLDRYPMQVEPKGFNVQFRAKRLFITTPKGPKETFEHWEWLGQENLDQLRRRIEHVIEFPQMGDSYNWGREPVIHGAFVPGFHPVPPPGVSAVAVPLGTAMELCTTGTSGSPLTRALTMTRRVSQPLQLLRARRAGSADLQEETIDLTQE